VDKLSPGWALRAQGRVSNSQTPQ